MKELKEDDFVLKNNEKVTAKDVFEATGVFLGGLFFLYMLFVIRGWF